MDGAHFSLLVVVKPDFRRSLDGKDDYNRRESILELFIRIVIVTYVRLHNVPPSPYGRSPLRNRL